MASSSVHFYGTDILSSQHRLKQKARHWITYILGHQQEDGWLGPLQDANYGYPYDPWPVFVLFKAMAQSGTPVPPEVQQMIESDPDLKHYEFKRRVQATVHTRSGGGILERPGAAH